MKFHIVANGESIKDILFMYSLTLDELKENNKHIRTWKELIPGSKIKIPVIPESVDEDIMDMEPFIEDYYPKNDDDGDGGSNQKMEEDGGLNQDMEENRVPKQEYRRYRVYPRYYPGYGYIRYPYRNKGR